MPGGSYFKVGTDVELHRVVVYLCILVACVMLFEQLLHKAEHAVHKYPKYHEMISKVYRELMILGLIGLGVKMVKEASLVDAYGKNTIAFQVADLTIFILALALIIQAICVFGVLRKVNRQLDKDELVSTADLVDAVKMHQALLQRHTWMRRLWPWTRAPPSRIGATRKCIALSSARYDEIANIRILKHFFLRSYKLPGLFPFSKYVRQAQDNQITHMIDVEISAWILLVIIAWSLDGATVFLEGVDHEVEQHAVVSMFIVFAWALVIFHFLVDQYLSMAKKKIMAAAGYHSRQDVVRCLQQIALEEAQMLSNELAMDAIEVMQSVLEEQEAKQGHTHGHHNAFADDTGFQLIKNCFRRIFRCTSHVDSASHQPELEAAFHAHTTATATTSSTPVPKVQIRFFSRTGLHFIVKFILMVNGFYFALMCQCVLYEMGDIYKTFGIIPVILVPLPLLINMVVFQPKICRKFILVSCIFRVEVSTLSDVISHFSETVELRSDFVACLMQSMQANGQSVNDLRSEFQLRDPCDTGLIEVEDLRLVLRMFGLKVSFFRFNSVAKLLFRLDGTKVEYIQVERLLMLAQQSDMNASCQSSISVGPSRYRHTVLAEEVAVRRGERASEMPRYSTNDTIAILARSSHDVPLDSNAWSLPNRFGVSGFSRSQQRSISLQPLASNTGAMTDAKGSELRQL
ncbi:hypothetical protein FI667_g8407, partial [Globisporangium splendens]